MKPKRKIIQISVSTSENNWHEWALCDDGTIWARVNDGGFGDHEWREIDTTRITQSA